MQCHMKIQSVFIFFLVTLFNINFITCIDSIDHHVICSLQKSSKTKSERKRYNHLIHQATYNIKQQCKKIYATSKQENLLETNHHYTHRRDTVFFVHFDHNFNSWTLYKPSFIPYNKFVTLIKKIYAQHGLQVICSKDQIVKVAKHDLGFDDSYLTLDEFEKYKKMSEDQFEDEIKKAEKESDNEIKVKKIKKAQKMQKFLFWHLQIPTTGLMEGGSFDIADQYKPIAWHFLLWDLAPKKGEGAHVAIIDTGASAFNLKEKEFSSIYKKNINITAPDILQNYGYNLVSENGLDPIRQITINFGHYCDHEKFDSNELMKNLPGWIIDFIKTKNNFQFEQYFIKNGKKEYLDKDPLQLNEKGEGVLKDLLYGKYGIIRSGDNSFFHTVHLNAPYNEEVLLETLPAPKLMGNDDPFAAGHGTFTQGVVNAKLFNNLGITGLAPATQVTMIKAFHDSGTTNKSTLKAALERAITLKNPIVSMSLKITDEFDKVEDEPLKELVDSIDYVVAASGNDGMDKKLANKEAYPAKFDSAFSYDNGQYPVCEFTQKELNIGPKFVAPGFDIFSSGLTPHQTDDSMYLFMAGTSIAVPIITGFIALVLAEFQDVFTREEILKVIYKFSIKLSNDETWQKYIKLGTPDMRSSLLCLHVLQSLRQTLEKDSTLKYSFQDNFDNLVQAIYTINYYVPSCYEEQINVSCTNNFAGYFKAVQAKTQKNEANSFTTQIPKKLSDCVNFFCKPILDTISSKKYNAQSMNYPEKLFKSLQNIVTTKKFKLFAKLSSSAQNRINGVLAPRLSCCMPEN